ncbi:MAG: cytochrome b5 [Desulfobacteraceae bacterium]|nr:MAG: cytochrome b5 [Desulfobacteraceae bacterium]
MKEFSSRELAEYNGKGGKPAYIGYGGKVYDVSGSRLWKTGLHMKRHSAGRDLTADLQASPHGEEVFERCSQVGVLIKAYVIQPEMPPALARLISRHPILRRHPHPMTVHFPIVFMISTTVFNILYLVTGVRSFEVTGFHCLGGGILFSVISIATGYFSWWINYLLQPMRPVILKRRLGFIMTGVGLAAFLWRMRVPDVLSDLSPASVVYFLLILSLFPLVTVIGWLGAHLTFPVEKE